MPRTQPSRDGRYAHIGERSSLLKNCERASLLNSLSGIAPQVLQIQKIQSGNEDLKIEDLDCSNQTVHELISTHCNQEEVFTIGSNSTGSDFAGFSNHNVSMGSTSEDYQNQGVETIESDILSQQQHVTNLKQNAEQTQIVELNSNSTTSSEKAKRQQLMQKYRDRNLTLNLTAVSAGNMLQRSSTESTSEFPVSSPTNHPQLSLTHVPQYQRVGKLYNRQPLLKNTLPVDKFEWSLNLISETNPQMSLEEKMESWQCDMELSDIEDVTNFDIMFQKHEEMRRRHLKIKKSATSKNNSDNHCSETGGGADIQEYSEFTNFTQFRMHMINKIKINKLGVSNANCGMPAIQKPSTSSGITKEGFATAMRRLKADNDIETRKRVHTPSGKNQSYLQPMNKKQKQEHSTTSPLSTSSSTEMRRGARATADDNGRCCSQQKRIISQQQQLQIYEKILCRSSSENSNSPNFKGSAVRDDNKMPVGSNEYNNADNHRMEKFLNCHWTHNSEEKESVFRLHRMNREIDKVLLPQPSNGGWHDAVVKAKNTDSMASDQNSITQTSPARPIEDKERGDGGLIQMRLDFDRPSKQKEVLDMNAKLTEIFNRPIMSEKIITTLPTRKNTVAPLPPLTTDNNGQKTELIESSLRSTEESNTSYPKVKTTALLESTGGASSATVAFHQQYEFCNYLGLTGMSTATAVANAVAELAQCNLTRRSLRVQRQLAQERRREIDTKVNEKCKPSGRTMLPNYQGILDRKRGGEDHEEIEKYKSFSTSLSYGGYDNSLELLPTFQSPSSPTPGKRFTMITKPKVRILCQIKSTDPHDCASSPSMKKNCAKEFLAPLRSNLMLHLKTSATREVAATITPIEDKNMHNNSESTGIHHQQMIRNRIKNYLEDSRQNKPSIFIVQSLDSNGGTDIAEKQLQSTLLEKEMPIQPQVTINENSQENYVEKNYPSSSKSSEKLPSTVITAPKSAPTVTPQTKQLRNLKTRIPVRTATHHQQIHRLLTRSAFNMSAQHQLRSRKILIVKTSKTSTSNTHRRVRPPVLPRLRQSHTTITTKLSKMSPKQHIVDKSKKCTTRISQHRTKSNNKMTKIPTPASPPSPNKRQYVKIRSPQPEVVVSSTTNDENIHLPPLISDNPRQAKQILNEEETSALVVPSSATLVATAANSTSTKEIYINLKFNDIGSTKNSDNHYNSSLLTNSHKSNTDNSCSCGSNSSPKISTTTVGDCNDNLTSTLHFNQQKNTTHNGSVNDAMIVQYLQTHSPQIEDRCSNPLDTTNGRVLHIYHELDILIVVQELLVSFWRHSKLLNLLARTTRETAEKLPDTPLNDSENETSFSGEWVHLGEIRYVCHDHQVYAAFANRLCMHNSMPLYVELLCRELPFLKRDCTLLSMYINVYYFKEEEMMAKMHSIQLDSVQSLPRQVIYTTISESRYFVVSWPQYNLIGKVRTGICKYSLTPDLDTLASIREFKSLRHELKHLQCLNDDKLVGFGETIITLWDHRSGDVLMHFDLELPLGNNLGSIYYPCFEMDQCSVLLCYQHLSTIATPLQCGRSEVLLIACNVSYAQPSYRILHRLSLPLPTFAAVRSAINTGERIILSSAISDEELWLSCTDPNLITRLGSRHTQRFYAHLRSQVITLSANILSVDSFASYLLKLMATCGNEDESIESAANCT